MKSLAIKVGLVILALFVAAYILGAIFNIAKLAFVVAFVVALGYGAVRLFGGNLLSAFKKK